MADRVDHQARRAQIIDGLIRFASREGLHQVSMRTVAAEAGVSLRLVQYYFGDKQRLMLAALEHLEQQSNSHWQQRLDSLPTPAPPRAVLDAFVDEALPDDPASRSFHLLFSSFVVVAMTDPQLAEQPFLAGPQILRETLAEVLQRAVDTGQAAPDLDVTEEADHLQALTHGLGTSVLIGHLATARARAILSRHLDRLVASFSGRA